MPKIQRTKEEAQKGDWSRENAGDKTTRRHEVDKAYGYWAEERMEANKARTEPETKVESRYA